MSDTFASSHIPFLDMAGFQINLGQRVFGELKPTFAEIGLALDSFVVESLSLPEELQRVLDQRIGMNMVGDLSRYTQFNLAQSIPIAAANEGAGTVGAAVGLGIGITMAQQMMDAIQPRSQPPRAQADPSGGADTKFCIECVAVTPR